MGLALGFGSGFKRRMSLGWLGHAELKRKS